MKFSAKLTVLILLVNTGAFAQSLDLRILEAINGPVNPGPDRTWRFVTNSAIVADIATPLTMMITGIATNDRNLQLSAIEDGGALIIAEGGTFVLKDIVRRERPYLAHPGLIVGKVRETDYSFPSGHASAAFSTAASLSIAFPKWYVIVPSYAFAGAVGYSRMYLGVHYPSDVLGGAILGSASAWLTWKAGKWLNVSRKKGDDIR